MVESFNVSYRTDLVRVYDDIRKEMKKRWIYVQNLNYSTKSNHGSC